MNMKEKAWIGDSILGLYAREFCIENGGVAAGSLYNIIAANDNLEFYAKARLDAVMTGTHMECHIYNIWTTKGPEAAEEFVTDICRWTFERLGRKPLMEKPKCEGCDQPSVGIDLNGTPLCEPCGKSAEASAPSAVECDGCGKTVPWLEANTSRKEPLDDLCQDCYAKEHEAIET